MGGSVDSKYDSAGITAGSSVGITAGSSAESSSAGSKEDSRAYALRNLTTSGNLENQELSSMGNQENQELSILVWATDFSRTLEQVSQ